MGSPLNLAAKTATSPACTHMFSLSEGFYTSIISGTLQGPFELMRYPDSCTTDGHSAPGSSSKAFNAFTLTTAKNLSSDFSGSRVTTHGGVFPINLWDSATYCPSPPVPMDQCPPGEEMCRTVAFIVACYGFLFNQVVQVPGGQNIYVAPNGAVNYTPAHSNSMPPSSYTDGFAQSDGKLIYDGHGAHGFLACFLYKMSSHDPKVFQLFTNGPDTKQQDCQPADLVAVEYTAGTFGAWQYT